MTNLVAGDTSVGSTPICTAFTPARPPGRTVMVAPFVPAPAGAAARKRLRTAAANARSANGKRHGPRSRVGK